tara:strand:- start:404 stop:1288 length:885 start_codon:yes stop_codon:yes gene_type:complete
MKNDLKDCTFIIPVRIESEDRLRNVITTCCFLLENFHTTVIVKEVDTKSVFEEEAFPQIAEYVEGFTSNLLHVFEKSDDPVFYRMRYLNEMLAVSTTDIVVNYDCDVLLPVSSYLRAKDMIGDGPCDMVYPYGMGNWQKQVHADDELVSEFLSNDCDFKILEKKSNDYDAQYGHVQFIKKQSYMDAGMENENFRGSSPEDKERFHRFTTLGYNVGRIRDWVYHLEHSRGPNSWPNSVQGNPYMQENFALWERLEKMDRKELKEYYDTASYQKKYKDAEVFVDDMGCIKEYHVHS